MELNLKVANTNKNLNKEMIDFGFLSSSNIKDIEDGIRKASSTGNRLALSICLAMHKIESEELFLDHNFKSFHAYLKNQDIIPYSTAVEYAYIGKNFIKLKKDLEKHNFNEESGIKKLAYVPKNYDILDDEQKKILIEGLVFQSARQFKLLASNINRDLTKKKRKKNEDKFTVKEIADMTLSKANDIINKTDFNKKEKLQILVLVEKALEIHNEEIKSLKKLNKLKI